MGRTYLALVIFTIVAIAISGCLQVAPAQPIPTRRAVIAVSTIAPAVPEPTRTAPPTVTSTTTPTAVPTSTDVPTRTPAPVPTVAPAILPIETPTAMAARRVGMVVSSTATPGGAAMSGSAHVPILMYHYISIPPENADIYRLDLSVKPSDFEKQLAYLHDNGYRTISLYDLYGHFALNVPLPEKPIILTFDDGYRDAYENAFPLLKKYGMSGAFFIVSDFINSNNPAYLTWDMIKEMSAAGMDIESHSRTHPDLRNHSIDYLVWQILGPIESISAYTGKRPHFFCYPSGDYDDGVIRVLKSADVWGAVTTHFGTEHGLDDAMTWSRVRIRGTTTVGQFAALVK